MNYFKLIFILTFLLIGVSLSAQKKSPIKFESKSYSFESEVYQFSELGPIMESHNEAYIKFNEGQKYAKAAKILGKITIGAMVVGTIAPLVDPVDDDMYCDLFCISTGQTIGILAWIFVVPQIGSAALITKAVSNKRKKKSILLFNDSMHIGYHNTRTNWDLKIGSTQSGVGLTVKF